MWFPDANGGADWIKKGPQAWDLPAYKSREFFQAIGGIDQLEAFKTSVAYRAAIDNHLIHDDEWVGDYLDFAKGKGP